MLTKDTISLGLWCPLESLILISVKSKDSSSVNMRTDVGLCDLHVPYITSQIFCACVRFRKGLYVTNRSSN